MTSEPDSSRVLVVDDHALLRKGMLFVLAAQPELDVVGEAGDGLEALRLCEELCPDLVLMDVSMPGMDGIEATRAIKRLFPGVVVLVITAHDSEDLMLDAIRAGAAGYVLKGEPPEAITGAIRAALDGESPMDQKLASRLLRQMALEEPSRDGWRRERASKTDSRDAGASLSPREFEVLERVVTGKTNRAIAQELHMSLSTVKRHLTRIISKLGVSDRTQAAVRALEMGLLSSTQADR